MTTSKTWRKPIIKHGKLTKYNYIVLLVPIIQNIQGTITSFMTGFGENFQTNPGSRGSKRLVCILLQAIPDNQMRQLH